MKRIISIILIVSLVSVAFSAFDDTPATCTSAGFNWFPGTVNGLNGACCGDDYIFNGFWETFYNSTHVCYQGSVSTNADYNKDYCESLGYDWFEADGDYFADNTPVDHLTNMYDAYAGDINGDGDLDIVAGSGWSYNRLVWYENNGGGNTWTTRTIQTSFNVQHVFVADIDGDGDLDVLTTGGWENYGLYWYRNNDGLGTSWTQLTIIGTSYQAYDVSAGDVDADGDMDVLVSSLSGDNIRWYENTDGAGTSWTSHNIITGWDYARTLVPVDFDGDGSLDLISNNANEISWFNNTNGDGTVWTKTNISDNLGPYPNAAFPGDIDGDGDMDAFSSSSGGFYWHENNNSLGTSWEDHFISTIWNTYNTEVFASDVDDDGDLDLVSEVYWHENNDSLGNFTTHLLYGHSLGHINSYVGDFTGDGAKDILTACSGGLGYEGVYVQKNYGIMGSSGRCCGDDGISDNFYANYVGSTTNFCYQGFNANQGIDNNQTICEYWDYDWLLGTISGNGGRCCGDDGILDDFNNGTHYCMNGNLDPDQYQVSCEAQGFNWLTGTITGSNGACCGDDGSTDTFYNNTHYCSKGGLLTDADSNSAPDWSVDNVGYTSGKSVCELKGYEWFHTSMNFAPGRAIETETGFYYASNLFSADLDGDGDNDVVASATDTNYVRWYNNTDGLGNFTTNTLSSSFSGAMGVHIADLDGDGDNDVIGVSGYGDLVSWWRNNNGDASSWSKLDIATISDARYAQTADIDGDGDLDVIVFQREGRSSVFWFENLNGLGTSWRKHIPYTEYRYGAHGFVSKLDNDFDADIVFSLDNSNGYQQIQWYSNGENNSWKAHMINDSINYPAWMVNVDLDGDGDNDILSAIRDEHNIVWWDNNDGLGNFTLKIIDSFSNAWRVYSADLDSDEDYDIIGLSYTDNTIAVWENLNGDATSWSKTVINSSLSGPYDVFASDLDGDGDLDILSNSQVVNGGKIVWYENLGLNGTNGPCCGDDLESDDFTNGTNTCVVNIDGSQSACEDSDYTWFTGTVTGSNGDCCGDDGVGDYFGNISACCDQGVFNSSGACPFSPAGCLDNHIDLNEDYQWSTYPTDDCGLVNCTDYAAIDEDIDYVWDGYCWSGALNNSCISNNLPPFNTSFTVTVSGNLSEIGTNNPVVGETITINANGVNYQGVTDEWGGWEVEVTYWELNCATSNTVTASFTQDEKTYQASKSFTSVK